MVCLRVQMRRTGLPGCDLIDGGVNVGSKRILTGGTFQSAAPLS